jgi:prepilin-type N-terminal cleavage/methylation domain-containing protein
MRRSNSKSNAQDAPTPKRLHKQRGVTLTEVMIAIAIIAMLIPSIMSMVQPFMNFYGKVDTDNRLKDIRTALTASYNTNALTIELYGTATLTTPDGTLNQVLPINRQCSGNATTFAAAKRFLSKSATEIFHDGFGRSFCVYITPRLSAVYNGVTFFYRNVLIVSPGVDGAIDPATTINADGTITVGGDDRSAFVDGRSIEQALVQQTMTTMDKIVAAYQNYFTSRYMVNTSRDTAVNYFANGPASWGNASNWDAGGWVASTAGTFQTLAANGLSQGLGLSVSEVTDSWGQLITVDNSSDSTRNPDNQASAAMQTPPYTATLRTFLPGGTGMTRTITGTY